jgi:hypothetical protein
VAKNNASKYMSALRNLVGGRGRGVRGGGQGVGGAGLWSTLKNFPILKEIDNFFSNLKKEYNS